MVTLNQVAKQLNDDLNTALGKTLNTDFDVYQFRIFPDTSDFKKPSRVANTVTHYIHGILTEINSTVEDTSASTVYGVLNTRLALVVPILEENENYMSLVGDIRTIIDAYLSKNVFGSMTDGTKTYTYSTNYSFSQSGTRQQDAVFGDCFRFYVYINYYLVENGLNSRAFKVFYDGQEIPYQTLNISRNTIMEGNVPANSPNMASKNIASSTQFIVKLTMPLGTDTASDDILAFLLDGDIMSRALTIRKTVDNNVVNKIYNVIINDANVSLQGVLNGGVTVTFAESLV